MLPTTSAQRCCAIRAPLLIIILVAASQLHRRESQSPSTDNTAGTRLAAELLTSRMGYGAMEITATYNAPLPDDVALDLLEGIQRLGLTFYDTAEVYTRISFGKFYKVPPNQTSEWYNEAILGRHLRRLARGSFTVGTKYNPFAHSGRCDHATVAAALDASLARLGLDFVDVYYLHRMPATLKLLDECMDSLKRLVADGKMRHIGLSEVPPGWLRRAHAIHPVSVIQQEWSLVSRDLEADLVPLCAQLHPPVGVVAYSPLARNLLANPERPSFRPETDRFNATNWATNKRLAEQVAALAAQKGASAAQLSLAWLYKRARSMGVSMVAIPGTTSLAHARDDVAALKLDLDDRDMAALEGLAATVAGARGTKQYMRSTYKGVST